jgi:hypothetical protein
MRFIVVVMAVVLTAGSSFAQHGMGHGYHQHGGGRNSYGGHSYGGHSYGSHSGRKHARPHAEAQHHRDAPRKVDDPSKADHNKSKRSDAARKEFMEESGYPKGRAGYVIDYIIPLKEGGTDASQNMRWKEADADDASAKPAKARSDKPPREPKAPPSDEPRPKKVKAPIA